MNEKKVVLVVVEGASEEAALGTIFQKFFSSDLVRFHVVHGDITTKDYITSDKIICKISEQLDILRNRYGYTDENYLRIIHLTDTDGVFIPSKYVIENKSLKEQKKICYYEERIETHSVQSTVERNERKREVLTKLKSTNKIRKIPYKIYYNSCNLEHVLHGRLENFTDIEKEDMADDFAEQYEDNIDDFIKFIYSNDVAVPGNYEQTWKYIWKNNSLNSLKRGSNMHLIFEDYNKI